jgi:hypothetical protein
MSETVEAHTPALEAVASVKGMKKNGTSACIGPTQGLTD